MSGNARPGAGLSVTVCGRTDRGRRREENQDSMLIARLDAGEGQLIASDPDSAACDGPAEFELGADGAILLVADGMGGRAGGARASSIAISEVRSCMKPREAPPSSDDFADRMRVALKKANRAIFDAAADSSELSGMGTTATLAGLFGDTVYVAQVGDSRAYLGRGTHFVRLTRDQSLVQDLVDSGIMDEEDAHTVKDNMLLQALGVGRGVRPDMTFHELRRGDVLLLCSDGLSQLVRDAEIGEIVLGASDLGAACDHLVALANERGGPDNITVVAARVDGERLSPADGSVPVARQPWKKPEN